MQRAKLQKEEKFKQSLKLWYEMDNRPFIRIKEHKLKDEQEYNEKHKRILKEKKRISAISGDPVEKIHLHDKWGNSEVYDFANRPLQ